MVSDENEDLPRYTMISIGFAAIVSASPKMTVGVKRRTHEKVQYCITAMEV